MSILKHDDNCPGCRPVAFDPVKGEALPASHPVMAALNRVWAATSPGEREAFHRVTCLNSRAPSDLILCEAIMGRLKKATAN